MQDTLCPFCEELALKNESWFADWEPFPVNIGHMKIMPFRHSANLFNLTDQEKRDFWEVLEQTKRYLDNFLKKRPDGYNVGINIGKAAGQTIQHLHIHIIPRYKGDVKSPRGGVRNIKPLLISW